MVRTLNEFISEVIGIVEPWSVSSVTLVEGEEVVNVKLEYDREKRPNPPHCECGGECGYYDMVRKTWRHTDLCEYICNIEGDVPRVRCKSCGKVFRVSAPWASDSISRYTHRFEMQLIRLAKEMPISAVSREMRVDDSTVWTILDRYVQRRMESHNLEHVHTYYVDEKAMRKGHDYLSTFLDQDHRVIFVGEGNSSDVIHDFMRYLEAHGGSVDNIRHVSMDMSGGFKKGNAECFPDAKVTFDRFHVVRHMTDAVNEVRRREYSNLLRAQEEERKALKGQRFLLLRNHKDLGDSERDSIKDLMSMFPDLGRTYIQKESLRATWGMEHKYDARDFLTRWIKESIDTGIKELIRVANTIERHMDGILNWYESRISNGVMEGFNSVLQAIKGRARGYRSFERYRTMIYLRSSGIC